MGHQVSRYHIFLFSMRCLRRDWCCDCSVGSVDMVMEHIRRFRSIPKRDSSKWFVVNECDEYEAGEFDTKQQADAWIAQTNAIAEWTDS